MKPLRWLGVLAAVAAACAPEPERPAARESQRQLDAGVMADSSSDGSPVPDRPPMDASPDSARDMSAAPDVAADRGGPEVGDARREVASDVAPKAATFANVRTILNDYCGVCHDGSESTDLRANAGLYARLVNAKPRTLVAACRSQTLVVPYMPTRSLLHNKIAEGGALAGCGMRMPEGCAMEPLACLSAADIKLIHDWILAGARM